MTDSNWLFLYTPIPYLVAMYVVAYRHDLARLVKPFRDLSSAHEWYSVCKHLTLVGPGVEPPSSRFMAGGRNLLLLFASAVIYAIPGIVPFSLPWDYLCAVQAATALPLFVGIVLNWTGPFPFKPYRDILPYPRLGTRIRHLGHAEGKRPPEVRPNSAPAGE